MGKKGKIIVVANQKGGVGKSTVCMALANYISLEMKFDNVGGIIDTDFQTSVVKKRESDLKLIEGTSEYPPYEVTSYNLDNYDKIPELIEELRKTGRIYIFDTPGRLNHQGIVALVTFADYLIIPFNYQNLILKSTIEFILFYNNLKKLLKEEQNYCLDNKLFFLPMMRDERFGTVADKELWERIRKAYMNVGVILPTIGYLKAMQEVNTIRLNKKQALTVNDAFYTFIDDIYTDTTTSNENGYAQNA